MGVSRKYDYYTTAGIWDPIYIHIHSSDVLLADNRKGIWHSKNLYHLYTEDLLQNNWKNQASNQLT